MIIRINMRTKLVKQEKFPDKYQLLGGRGLTSRMLLDEIDPTCAPLGANNKLVIAPGLLGGTAAPCSGRLSVGAKSPLTGGIKESNGGGTAGGKLAKIGVKAIVIEDQPIEENFCILIVSSAGVRILPAVGLEGKGNYETANILQKKYGAAVSVISIGPAGERGYSLASVAITDMEGHPSRHCGRGGMGAVMGSKKIKAIVVDNNEAPAILYQNEKLFKEISKEWAQNVIPLKKGLTEYGTANLVNLVNSLGALPTRNYSYGSFTDAEQISGEYMKQRIEERGGKPSHACHPGCVIRCSNIYNDSKGNYLTSGLEYETIALLGSNCGISDLDFIAQLDNFCDDFGIDTMELGITLGVIMESGWAPFGDIDKMVELIGELKKDTLLGKLMGQGAVITGKVLGVQRVPAVKGQGISGYDPRGLQATGVTYATTPMGGDHTAGNCLPGRTGYRPETKDKDFLSKPEGMVELAKDMQVMTAVYDICGLCFFLGPSEDDMLRIAKLINAKSGVNLTAQDVIGFAKQLIKDEVEFNEKAGLSQSSNGLPEFFSSEKLGPYNYLFNISKEKMIQFYKKDC